MTLCTFTPTKAGDYYLQIRTNVALGGTAGRPGRLPEQPQGRSARPATTPRVIGSGNNRFALRVKGAQRGAVSIAGYQHMSIYANYTGANTTFNLVRVIPAAATKTLKIGFYDVGDATQPGTITGAAAARLEPRRLADQLHRAPAWSTARCRTAS